MPMADVRVEVTYERTSHLRWTSEAIRRPLAEVAGPHLLAPRRRRRRGALVVGAVGRTATGRDDRAVPRGGRADAAVRPGRAVRAGRPERRDRPAGGGGTD